MVTNTKTYSNFDLETHVWIKITLFNVFCEMCTWNPKYFWVSRCPTYRVSWISDFKRTNIWHNFVYGNDTSDIERGNTWWWLEFIIIEGAKEILTSSWWILLSLLAACTMNSLSWLETPRLTRLWKDYLSWARTSQDSGSMWHFLMCPCSSS